MLNRVKLVDLWNSMTVIDEATGKSRGYFVLSIYKQNDADIPLQSSLQCSFHVENKGYLLNESPSGVDTSLTHQLTEFDVIVKKSVTCPPLLLAWSEANSDISSCSCHIIENTHLTNIGS